MGFWQNVGDAFVANLRTGGNGPAARQEFRRIRAERKEREWLIALRLGQIAITASEKVNPPSWSKYTSSTGRNGVPQTNYFEGHVGEQDQRRKVHIVVDANGTLQYVRDISGEVLFDRSRGHTPPPGWD